MTDVLNIIDSNQADILNPPKPPPLLIDQEFNRPAAQPPEPVIMVNPDMDTWFLIKKEYLEDRDVEVKTLAKKHGVEWLMIAKRVKEEGWESQRTNLFARADAKYQNSLVDNVAEVKGRHAQVGRMLQKIGVQSLKKYKKNLEPKEALAYIVEGIKAERDAHGLGKDQPRIVNIITQQQAILEKYKQK